MAGVIGFIVFVLLIMGLWQKRLDRSEKAEVLEKFQDAVGRGSNKPIAQFPQINPYACIGCGSCIEACPEDEVIGLVMGVAHIVHGSRCVGHGHCEYACPVGAIKVGLGDVSQRPDIPVLSEELETSIPGVFIAGELGGIALIRNAIAQGTRAVDIIAKRLGSQTKSATPGLVDVAIIGAGPTGIAACLRAKELRFSFTALSQDDIGGAVRKYPRKKLTLIQTVTLPLYGKLKGGEIEKEELIAIWEKVLREQQIQIEAGHSLKSIKRLPTHLEVSTSAGRTIAARSVILAMGRRGIPRKLNVPGEESSKVLYELLDAATYTGQKVLVVGGGDSAVEAAMSLANQRGNQVSLSYRKENFFRLKSRNEQRIRDYMAQKRIQVYFSSGVCSVDKNSVTLQLEQPAPKTVHLPNDVVFVFAGGDPPYPLLKQFGVKFGGAPGKAAA